MSLDWNEVRDRVAARSRGGGWKYGQADSLAFIAEHLREQPGILIADEVGLGKTRLGLAVLEAVLECGGTAAVVVPPGLVYQWRDEWHDYRRSSNPERKAGPADEPLVVKGYKSIFEAPYGKFPLSRRGTWLLMSHTFGPPQVRTNSRPWRFRLPALAAALRMEQDGDYTCFRRTKLWQFAKTQYDCWEKSCDDCDELRVCAWYSQERAAARFLASRPRLQKALRELSADDCTFDPVRAAAYFDDKGGPGWPILLRAIGELVGPLDLLVIDEVHKGKDRSEEDQSLLGRLIHRVLRVEGRRVALTATPVQLSELEWGDVLRRIGVEPIPLEEIQRFAKAQRRANAHPDQIPALEELAAAAKGFEAALRPYVTRRRRIHQPEMQALVGALTSRAHPHRHASTIAITHREVSLPWKRAILALEGLGKAAKGLDTGRATQRLADIRYASGLISPDMGAEHEQVEGSADPPEQADDLSPKARRLAFWQRVLRDSTRSRAPEDGAALADHPRILRVADHIEQVLSGDATRGEKILAFGVFTLPLRALRDTLNRRAALRLLDRDMPVPGAEAMLKDVESLWVERRRIVESSQAGHALPLGGALGAPSLTSVQLRELLKQARLRYDAMRRRLTEHIDLRFLNLLPGDAAIRQLDTADRQELAQLLRTRIVNDWVFAPEEVPWLTERGVEAADQVRKRAVQIWSEYLWCHIEREEGDEELQARTTFTNTLDFEPAQFASMVNLDRLGDNLEPGTLVELVRNETTEGAVSSFARFMYGDTKMHTRRVVQAQFNNPNSFPRVLIAQSQVGREGLNLHTCCRRVILFHTEWNPAVIEQQIGRVDRIKSLWETMASTWRKEGAIGAMPQIEVEHVVFEGTYDEYQANVFTARRQSLNANLFGELLDETAQEHVPPTMLPVLQEAVPDFSPTKPAVARQEPPTGAETLVAPETTGEQSASDRT